MSGKAFYHKTPPVPALQDIPPEIWSTIIQYAAESGSGLYEYEMTPSDHADFLRGEDKHRRIDFLANFCTPSRISLVHKTWYSMVSPFLFEYIHLADGRKIPFLCEAILRSKESAESDRSICPFGWWTKRLDIVMRESGNGSYVPQVVSQLSDMIPCFSNLRILTFLATGNDYDDPETLSLLDVVSAPQSLRAMVWPTFFCFPSCHPVTDKWTAFLERHPRLESILGPGEVKTENKIALESLAAIQLYGREESSRFCTKLTACHMPRLRCMKTPYADDVYLNKECLHRLGTQLSVIELGLNSFRQLVPSLTGVDCPNLIQINISAATWPEFTENDASSLLLSKSLKTLGLEFYHRQIPSRKALQELLMVVFPVFNQSSVTTIRFLAENNVKALQRHQGALEDGMEKLARLGITLKDHNSRNLVKFKRCSSE